MSAQTVPLVIEKVPPLELQYVHTRVARAYLGPMSRSFQQFIATSGTSSTSVNFTLQSPSPTTIVRKNIMIYWSLFQRIVGTDVGATLFGVDTDAPRDFPVSSNILAMNGSIGNSSFQIASSGQYLKAMMRYYATIQERSKHLGTCPNYPDPLGPGANQRIANPGTYAAFTGDPKDPLASGEQGFDHRGDWQWYLSPLLNGGAPGANQEARFVSCEPLLMLTPFGQSCTSDGPGFANVQNMTVQMNLNANLNIWSKKNGTVTYTVTASSAGFYAAPVALLEFWNPPESLIPMTPLVYPISQVVQFQQADVTAATNTAFQVNFNNIQVNQVPNAMIIFCKPKFGQVLSAVASVTAGSIYAMDNFAGIPQVALAATAPTPPNTGIVKITFDAQSGQLSDMTAQQLYNMQIANGVESLSFSEFCAFGGVMKFYFGKDIFTSKANVVGGSKGSFNLQVQASFQNNFATQVIFEPWMILITEGNFTITNTGNDATYGGLTEQDIIQAPLRTQEMSKFGNGLFGTIGKIGTTVLGLGEFSGIANAAGNIIDGFTGTEWKGEGDGLYQRPRGVLKRMREAGDTGGYDIR